MKKALFVATIGSFFNFEKSDMQILSELGYEIHCAADFANGDSHLKEEGLAVLHQIDFSRSPYSKQTLIAYKELKDLLEIERYDIIHCHTPVGGILTRLAAKKYRKCGTKIIYTAHGFHFYKGAPIKNWIIYYSIEKICSRWTDVLITINTDDYKIAKKKLVAKKVVYIPGVGIDLEKFSYSKDVRNKKRLELGLKDETMLLSVGELCERKNHRAIINVLKQFKDENFCYFIVGEGSLDKELQNIVNSLGLENKVFLLGVRRDVAELCNAADLYLFPSYQEGLPVALMEAIACKCPVIVSDIRGNRDLVKNSEFRFPVNHESEKLYNLIAKNIRHFNRNNWTQEIENNYNVLKAFSKQAVQEKMRVLYKEL